MWTKYIKITLRNLARNKVYTVLNMLGLTAGITCFAFIALWTKDEYSYDRFNDKADRIFRLIAKVTSDAEVFDQAVTSVPMGPNLKMDFPEVENFVRFDLSDAIVKSEDKTFVEDGILATDPSFFDVFSYKLKKGDPKTALNDPFSLVLTESMAAKYFGDEDPIGKSLTIMLYDSTGNGQIYKITGVIPDARKNAHFTFNCITSFESLIVSHRQDFLTDDAWGNNSYYTYILLKEGVDSKNLGSKLPQFYEKHILPINKKYGGTGRTDYFLQPLTDIYLKSHLRYELGKTSSSRNLYLFGTIGFFILLIAGINYMNLATARSVQRAKEVGVKKVIGAFKSHLIIQFISESLLLAIGSFGLAIILSILMQPLFFQVTGKNLSLLNDPALLTFIGIIALVLGLIAGIYPAFFLASFKPSTVLKGSFKSSTQGVWLRQSLVVFQFTISIVLIVGIFIVQGQRSYIQNKDLGYQRDALLALKINGDVKVRTGVDAFRNDVLTNPFIKNFTTSNSALVGGLSNGGSTTVNEQGQIIQANTNRLMVGYNFLTTMGIKLVAGRDFSPQFPADLITDTTQNFILNEAAVNTFGWVSPEKSIGKPFAMNGRKGNVVGIVKDFHFNSLLHKIDPVAITLRKSNFSQIILKIDMQNPQAAIQWVENNWKKHFPESYFEYDFVDKKLNEQYQAEDQFGKIFLYFSVLSILIACLGLYGLTAFATQQRTKEIGIRKVLGASVTAIVSLLSRDFLMLVFIALLLATPAAYYFMNNWLLDFEYRIEIKWWVFVMAGSVAILIAFSTISFQAIRAALMSSVKTLKTE